MFVGFVDESGKPISSVTMDANKTVTAKFTVQQYPLNIYTKTDDGIKPYSVKWYASGTKVKLSSISVSVSGMRFKGWLNDALDFVSTVTINSETTVYAELYKTNTHSEEEEETETDTEVIMPSVSPAPSESAQAEVSPTPEASVTPAPEATDEAKPAYNVTDSGLAWYWWVLIVAGVVVVIGGGVLMYLLTMNKRKKRKDVF
jgi:hypothetical protein